MTPDRTALSAWFPGYLALTVIWGSSFLFIKVGVAELHPVHVTLGRVVTGAIAVLVILAATRTKLPRDLRTWGHFAVVGIGAAVPFTLFGYAEQRIPSLLAGIWNATTPLFVMPIAVLAFRTEKFTARRIVGLLTGFVGVLVVLGVWQGVGGAAFTGQLMCLGAALCYGIVIPYARRYLSDLDGAVAPAGQLIMAVVVMIVASALMAVPPPALASLSWTTVASVVALGALGTGVAFVLNFRVIKFAGASTAASVTYLAPVVATVIGVVGLGEQMSWRQPIGALIVLFGVAVAQGVFRRRERPRPAVPEVLPAPSEEPAR